MRSERELLIAAAGQLEVFGEESPEARKLADEINLALGTPKMRQRFSAMAKLQGPTMADKIAEQRRAFPVAGETVSPEPLCDCTRLICLNDHHRLEPENTVKPLAHRVPPPIEEAMVERVERIVKERD